MTIRFKCPRCGSENIRGVDRVLQTTTVTAWDVNPDGSPRPDEFGDDCETWYDSCEPNDPTPFDCADCYTNLRADELVRCDDDFDPEEDDELAVGQKLRSLKGDCDSIAPHGEEIERHTTPECIGTVVTVSHDRGNPTYEVVFKPSGVWVWIDHDEITDPEQYELLSD